MKLLIGTWTIKEAQRANFLELCRWITPQSHAEEGLISYRFSEDQLAPNTFIFVEEWRDQAAIDFHVVQDYFKEFMEKATPMLEQPLEARIYAVEEVVAL
jgi:quinol monooxygenase YgiN